MGSVRTVGLAAVGVGLVLLGVAYHASGAPIEQLSDALTGRFTDRTMWLFMAGGAAVVGGAVAAALAGRR